MIFKGQKLLKVSIDYRYGLKNFAYNLWLGSWLSFFWVSVVHCMIGCNIEEYIVW